MTRLEALAEIARLRAALTRISELCDVKPPDDVRAASRMTCLSDWFSDRLLHIREEALKQRDRGQ